MLQTLLNTHIWALEPRYYNMAKSVILARMDQGLPALDESLVRPHRMRSLFEGQDVLILGATEDMKPEARVAYRTAQVAGSTAGQVAVIPIVGTMNKRSDYCATGTSEIAAAIQQAYMDPNVSAIVLHNDSGGGAVDGTEYLGNTVAEQRKPIVSFVDGLSASANLWVGAQANHIMMSSKTTAFIGSIGVLAMHLDQTGLLEKNGTKVTVIRSSKAVDKARMNSVEPLTEELLADYVAQLDTIHNTFISSVKEGRGRVLGSKKALGDDLFTGKVYNGQQAVKNGLADSFGSLSDAIRMADSLARKRSSSTRSASATQSTTPMMKNLMALVTGAKPAAAPAAEEQPAAEQSENQAADEQQEEITEEQLTAADEQIGALRVRVGELEQQAAAAALQLSAAQAQVAAATEQLTAAQAQVTQLTAANEQLTASNAQLETWKSGNTAFISKQQDESNKGDKPPVAKGGWEIEADKVQELAHKRKS